MNTRQLKVITLAPHGLGFGEGPISLKDRLENIADPLNDKTMEVIDRIMVRGDVLVPISRDDRGKLINDDGCGDGRGVHQIMRGKEILKKSLDRAKVFGGGLTMGVSACIGIGKANANLKEIYSLEAAKFNQLGLNYGVHTDENFNEKKSGCGAIDKALQNIANAVKYKAQIGRTIEALGEYVFRPEDLELIEEILGEVFKNYKDYYDKYHDQDYTGYEIINLAAKEHKVVKELDSKPGHKEVAIALNLVPDMTANQRLARDKTGNVAQIFDVDIPRLQEIADRRYEDSYDRKVALVSMLVYTLSTATTLTDGTLPVYVIETAS